MKLSKIQVAEVRYTGKGGGGAEHVYVTPPSRNEVSRTKTNAQAGLYNRHGVRGTTVPCVLRTDAHSFMVGNPRQSFH